MRCVKDWASRTRYSRVVAFSYTTRMVRSLILMQVRIPLDRRRNRRKRRRAKVVRVESLSAVRYAK